MGMSGCGSQPNKQIPTNDNDSDTITYKIKYPQDPTITLIANGITKTLKVAKYEVKDCLEIKKLSLIFKNRLIDTTLVRYLDITGDGIPDKIVGHLFVRKDSIYCIRSFLDRDKIFDIDSFADCLNDSNNNYDFGIKSYLCPFEPYASVQEFTHYLDVCNDTQSFYYSYIYRNDEEVSYDPFDDYHRKGKLNKSEYSSKIQRFRKYLKTFKGIVIRHNEHVETTQIWYEPRKMFVYVIESE